MKFKRIISLSMASALALNTVQFDLQEINAEQTVANELTTGSAIIPEAIIPEINFKPDINSSTEDITSTINIEDLANATIKVYDENNNEITNGENVSIGETINIEIIPNEFYSLKEVIINHKWYTDFTNNDGIYLYAYEVTQTGTNIGADISMDISPNDAVVDVNINDLITDNRTSPASSSIWNGGSTLSITLNNTVVADENADNYLVIPSGITDIEIIGDANTVYREVKIVRENYDENLNITIENLKLTSDLSNVDTADKSGILDVATTTSDTLEPTSLTFKGENIITSNGYDAAINIPDGRSLEINSTEGNLEAIGCDYSGTMYSRSKVGSSAIGSAYGADSGNITINSGNITAYGNTGANSDNESDGTGIGTGKDGDVVGSIIINGGNINAYGSTATDSNGAGIGTGKYGNIEGSIIIDGGNINAYSSNGFNANGAGIGTGSSGDVVGQIIINNGNINAYSSNSSRGYGAGIGTGNGGIIEANGDIIINNGEINAWSTESGYGGYGAGIGTGYWSSLSGSIVINDGTVHAYSAEEGTGIGAGIGTGGYYATTNNCDINKTGSISINGGEVYARSSEMDYGYGAGIGTGGSTSESTASGGHIYGSINIRNVEDLYLNSYATKYSNNNAPENGAGIGTGGVGSLVETGSINITNVDNDKKLNIEAYALYNKTDNLSFGKSSGIGAFNMMNTSSINITDATGIGDNNNFNIKASSVESYENTKTVTSDPGIGARYDIAEGASINIGYGNIEATSGTWMYGSGSSIGGNTVAGSINIDGGNLLLLNSGKGSAIGSSLGDMSGDINISDGNIVLSSYHGAGIGSGQGNENYNNGGNEVTGRINITGGNIVFSSLGSISTNGIGIGQVYTDIVQSKTGELNITNDAFVFMPTSNNLITGIYMPSVASEEENITIDEDTLFLGANGNVQGLFKGVNEDLSDSYTKIKFDIENENGGDELIPYYNDQMKVINFSNNLFSLPDDFSDELLAKADMDRVDINEEMSNFNYSTNYTWAYSSFNDIGGYGDTATKVFLKNGAWELNANDKDEKYFIESKFDLNDFVSLDENNTSVLNVDNELVKNSDYKMYLPNFKLISDSSDISAEETKVVRTDNDFEWVDTKLTGTVSINSFTDIKVLSAYKFDENGKKIDLNIIYGEDNQVVSENDILFTLDGTTVNPTTGNIMTNYIVNANNIDSDIHLDLNTDWSLVEPSMPTVDIDIDRGDVETLTPVVDPDRGEVGTLTPTVDPIVTEPEESEEIDRGEVGTLTPTVDPIVTEPEESEEIDRGEVGTLTPTVDPIEPEITEPEESEDNGSTIVEPVEPVESEATEPVITAPIVTEPTEITEPTEEPVVTEPTATETIIPESTEESGNGGTVIIEPEESEEIEDIIELLPNINIPLGNITLVPSESGIEDEYIIIDENGVPLGTVIAKDGNVENIVVDTFIPFGSPYDDRANPHTGMSNNKEIALLGLGGLMVVLARKKKMLGRKI